MKEETSLETKLIDYLLSWQKGQILRSGVAILNLREGTLTEEKVIQFLQGISILGLWMDPNLPSTP